MGEPAQLAFEDVLGGMNAFDPPHKIATNQVARMVNCGLVNGLPTTRFGARVVPLSGSSREFVSLAAVQGSISYNPAKGQGGIVFAASNSTIALAAGGRKFLVNFEGKRETMKGVPVEITKGLFVNGQNHLCWLGQWEDLLVAMDGEASTFIYNPATGARFSLGYNTTSRLDSEIPNGATCPFYAHGRGGAVVNSRNILVGDSIHRTNLTSSVNLIGFTEQTYFATGQYFLPPSAMGGINAVAILPLQNTQHGHGDVFFHLDEGVFSLDINRNPRSSWADLSLVKHALLSAGACGPYAIGVADGDQVFRTRKGVTSLRSAAAQPMVEGRPERPFSPQVETWLAGDYPRWLRFAFVTIWDSQWKSFCSTAPIVQGSFRWHRGMVVRNMDVSRTTDGEPNVWEGLWTFPPQFRGIIQTNNVLMDGEEKLFAWTRGNDARNRLVELSPIYRADVLEDGTKVPIRCQVMTRAIDAGKWWQTREYTETTLFLAGIEGAVNWGVWFRTAEGGAWKYLRSGTVTVQEDVDDLGESPPRSVPIDLGRIPGECQKDVPMKSNVTRAIQFLVRWQGFCQFEGIKVEHGVTDERKGTLDKARFNITFAKPAGADYDDFEYSLTPDPLWIEPEQ